jgi:uncharacterized protein YqjF (DUF2071 family)
MWSSMRLTRAEDVFTYTCRRRAGGPAATNRIAVRAGTPIPKPTPTEHFITARWGLHVSTYGHTRYVPNVHPQWTLHRAELLELDDELVAATGLPAPDTAPVSVLYAPGVPVRFGPPVRADRP